MDYSEIRGFNYQPSYGSSSFENWLYFNPEKIGEATVLFTIPVKDGKKVYADFHKSVKDYVLPFPANAKTVVMESSKGVTLKGNKVSVSGNYGYIVVKVK